MRQIISTLLFTLVVLFNSIELTISMEAWSNNQRNKKLILPTLRNLTTNYAYNVAMEELENMPKTTPKPPIIFKGKRISPLHRAIMDGSNGQHHQNKYQNIYHINEEDDCESEPIDINNPPQHYKYELASVDNLVTPMSFKSRITSQRIRYEQKRPQSKIFNDNGPGF